MFAAKSAIVKALGCEVHLATASMIRRVQTTIRKPGESNLAFLARLAIIDMIGGEIPVPDPVIVHRPGVISRHAVFRGTRVPPAPIFALLGDLGAEAIVRRDYPSLSTAEIEGALRQACWLLERYAPWEDG
jgi:uncharacterized protein (DUF433 family)